MQSKDYAVVFIGQSISLQTEVTPVGDEIIMYPLVTHQGYVRKLFGGGRKTLLVSCAGLVSPMNNLSSDSFYLWAYIKPSTYLPYPGDMEYVCYAAITQPKFKLLIS